MRKQPLTKRQQTRINKKQQQHRARATEYTSDNNILACDEQEGIVTAHYSQVVEIEDIAGVTHRCYLRKNLGTFAVGDQVIWQMNNEKNGVVVAIKPRFSELFRFNKMTGQRLIAANVEQLFIITAPEPTRAINIIDRYLMLAEIQKIKPMIIYNKTDLLDSEALNTVDDYLSYYQELGYPVIYTSANQNIGVEKLLCRLKNRTSIFVGLSGVGKSSLINTIFPDTNSRVNELSTISREGNHTTTTAKLYHFPSGGKLIDCPGIRELAIGKVSAIQVLSGFKELATLATQCQFRNCTHTQEINCAILTAEAKASVNLERLASYRNIIAQLELHN